MYYQVLHTSGIHWGSWNVFPLDKRGLVLNNYKLVISAINTKMWVCVVGVAVSVYMFISGVGEDPKGRPNLTGMEKNTPLKCVCD